VSVVAGRTIFRESALEAYRRNTTRDVLPRLTSWPAIACAWALIGVLGAVVVLTWSVRVPMYIGASGVILSGTDQVAGSGTETAAVLFVPPDQSGDLRIGQPVHGWIGSTDAPVAGAVIRIEPDLLGPDAARERYGLGDRADLVTQPSNVVIVRLRQGLSPSAYGGSRVNAQIQVGTQRLLALFPGLGELFGEGS
jgi:hypothetical protein